MHGRPREHSHERRPQGRRRRRRPNELGALGEGHAAAHMQRLGFAVLARNVRGRGGEIDLVAFDGRTLVFAEVKTTLASAARPRVCPQQPLARLGGAQRARIRRLAAAWLCAPGRAPFSPRELRLDAIGVVVDAEGRLLALEHLESAW